MVNSRHNSLTSTKSPNKASTMINGTDSATVKRELDRLLETYDNGNMWAWVRRSKLYYYDGYGIVVIQSSYICSLHH